MNAENATVPVGSSPRGRGKRRLTASGPSPSLAHPRAGGENLVCVVHTPLVAGSSPRGRGKQVGCKARVACHGLIPARAGKT